MKSLFAEWLIPKFSQWLLKDYAPKGPSLMTDFQKIRFEVRPGDVLLIEGHNRASRIIKRITQSNWSHSSIYIGRLYDIDDIKVRSQLRKFYKGLPDEQLVIESYMGQGTVINPLSAYKNEHIRVCRPRGLSRMDAQKVINFAIARLGSTYSLRHILDLARFMLPWGIIPRRWRSSLFVHNALKPTEEICCSMIASAFQTVHFPILPEIKQDNEGITLVSRNPKLFTPKDFDYSPFFDIIKYPILPLDGEGIYQRLPWVTDSESGTDYLHIKNTFPTENTEEVNKEANPNLPVPQSAANEQIDTDKKDNQK
jgi:hypothetical protein